MKPTDLNRRDFAKLTAAAFGGMIAGTAIGCGEGAKKEAGGAKAPGGAAPEAGSAAPKNNRPPGYKNPKRNGDDAKAAEEIKKKIEAGEGDFVMLSGKNVCRGLNVGKNHKGGSNDCAGRGECASIKAHDCSGQNECKGQGGCGENPGTNACKGKGGCHVPLMDEAWTKARAKFEKVMTSAGRPIGPAPEAKK
jgi:hypothetical protein